MRRPPPCPAAARPRAEAEPDEDQPFATPWEELADAYDALPAEDADARRVYLRKIVEVWERGQKDIDRALDALERAFRLDIKDEEIRAELERIGGQYDRWDRVVEIYLGAIDEFGPIDTAVALHHDVARLRERLGPDRQGRGALRRDPAPQVRRRGRPGARRGDLPRRSSAGRIWRTCSRSGPARRPRRCRSGPSGAPACASWPTLYEERLERPYEAIDTLERLLVEVGRRGAEPRRGGDARRDRRDARRARGAGAALLARRPVGQGRRQPASGRPS